MSWYIISFLALSLLLKYSFFLKYSCTNIFHRRSLCTLYKGNVTSRIVLPCVGPSPKHRCPWGDKCPRWAPHIPFLRTRWQNMQYSWNEKGAPKGLRLTNLSFCSACRWRGCGFSMLDCRTWSWSLMPCVYVTEARGPYLFTCHGRPWTTPNIARLLIDFFLVLFTEIWIVVH